MNIAIAVDGDNMASEVSEQFEHCENLLIVNVETKNIKVFPNLEASEAVAGERLAQEILKHSCEAVISGLIRTTAFEMIAGNGVTRFLGVGHDATKALALMDSNSLEVIRDADGRNSCGGSHHDH